MKVISQDYLNDILVRIAHHSSGIEGNTITLPQTVSIIVQDYIPSQINVREFFEVKNHEQAFYLILSVYEDNISLSVNLVKSLHEKLMDRLQHDKGQFKKQQNAIVGADFMTATPTETPMLMQQWVDNTLYRLELAITELEKLSVLAEMHIVFERIHPFSDGNGRVGRMILLFQALQIFGVPIIINKQLRQAYMQCLAEQDIAGLSDLLAQSLLFERERQEQFYASDIQEIKYDI